MGFHKRHINDEQVIRLYRNGGVDAVLKWYTQGVDALILSGTLAEEVDLLMTTLPYNKKSTIDKIEFKINNYQST
jgi:hypothetical protein|tara:strand:- start:1022 stop:1246 length:225 start_codon:yes stop_codon:yes gene_type:complete